VRVNVKLFGTLGQNFPGYDSLEGMEVDIPDDARVVTLLAHLDIPKTRGVMVTMGNTIAKPADKLISKAVIKIFQTMAGG
jgi:sulfur carrier protein ThiS